MSLLKLHHISFTIVAVAYATPRKDPLALRRIMIGKPKQRILYLQSH